MVAERNIKDGTRDDKGNAFGFQRDADISTFKSLDQAWPFHSLTFHLKSRRGKK